MTNLGRITDNVMAMMEKKNGHVTAIVSLALELDRLEQLLRGAY
jgi:hypothetical protein